jgi:hypothetical protein
MKIFAQLLKQQSPSIQLPSFGHGWLELPNGQRWQPTASKVMFLGGKRIPQVQIKRRPWWIRIMGIRREVWRSN